MSKKKKKQMTVTEMVGDTSGFNEDNVKLTKNRKINLFLGIGGIVVLLAVAIIFFVSPTKVTFNYMNNREIVNATYEVDKKTGLLKDYPSDDIAESCTYAKYFNFEGWCGNSDCTGVVLKAGSSKKETSLAKHQFNKFKSTTLYAKWEAIEFTITYDVIGNLENFSKAAQLKELNATLNPSTYTIKHEATSDEITAYQEKLRKDGTIDENATLKEINQLVEEYKTSQLLDQINLKSLTASVLEKIDVKSLGWTFEGWYDSDGNLVTSISKTSPKNITLTAKWTKNR